MKHYFRLISIALSFCLILSLTCAAAQSPSPADTPAEPASVAAAEPAAAEPISEPAAEPAAAEPASEPAAAEAAPVNPAGTWLELAMGEKSDCLAVSDTLAQSMVQDALGSYAKDGINKSLVLQENGSGEIFSGEIGNPVLLKDGYLYTVNGGHACVIQGNILATGMEGNTAGWMLYYKLTDEQTASLPKISDKGFSAEQIVQIPVHSESEESALLDVIGPVLSNDGNPNDVFDEAQKAVAKAASEEAASEAASQTPEDTAQDGSDLLGDSSGDSADSADSSNSSAEEANESAEAAQPVARDGADAADEADQNNIEPATPSELFSTFAETQLTMARIVELNGGTVPVGMEGGHITFIGGTCTDSPVENEADAYKIVESMFSLLGCNESCTFEPFGIMTDSLGNMYYVFQQFWGPVSVTGGAIKIAVNKNNEMIGLFSSIMTDLPEQEDIEMIDPSELAQIVYTKGYYSKDMISVNESSADITLIPIALFNDPSNPPAIENNLIYAWVVYSDNPQAGSDKMEAPAYLAHYITLDGEYLYAIPVYQPGDKSSETGSISNNYFENMEREEWTGEVSFVDGSTDTITVPVMKDPSTGTYYLADPQRKIAVADCYNSLYTDEGITLRSSETNADWNNYDLITYYNIIRVWDFYEEIGWTGGDGQGTPILILMDFCSASHEPVDNAGFVGRFEGWQTFAFSYTNYYGMALDVVTHEFTHSVTNSATTGIISFNDVGAMDEAISDIMGNICEMTYKATEDPTWAIGEKALNPLRSMSNPHVFQQPEYVWDIYYQQRVEQPNRFNDQGGVHTNNALLNRIAYRLCEESGMSLSEAREFWTSVECTLTPGTSFQQLSMVLPWVMDENGLGKYTDDLKQYIADARLSENSIPSELKDDRTMVVLELPDKDLFKGSGAWLLALSEMDYTKNFLKLKDILEILNNVMKIDTASVREVDINRFVLSYTPSSNESALQSEASDISENDETAATLQITPLGGYIPKEAAMSGVIESTLGSLEYIGTKALDGQFIRVLCPKGYKIIMLTHINEQQEQDCILTYMNGTWSSGTPSEDANIIVNVTGDYLILSSDGLEDMESLPELPAEIADNAAAADQG